MINKIFMLFFLLYLSNGVCGVSVIGTRFLIHDDMQHLNIKLTNDNESDYLIKSSLDDKNFIISPPLLLLPKNSSHVITIVPKEKKQYTEDKIINLTVTAIPKSTLNDSANVISMAVRNHFKVIYRHAKLQNDDFNKIKIIIEDRQCTLKNDSKFVFTISLSKDKNNTHNKIINLPPGGSFLIKETNLSSHCEVWVNFHNEYNDIIKTIKVTK